MKKEKANTINQAVLLNDLEAFNSFLDTKVNKGHFKFAMFNAVKLKRNDYFVKLFEFNSKNNIIELDKIFPELFNKACYDSNNIFVLDYLKNNTQFKLQLINAKSKEHHYFHFLFNNIASSNDLESLQWLLTDNLDIIKSVINAKDSQLAFKKSILNLFIHSCQYSKKSIIEYLFSFDFVQADQSNLFQALKGAINYQKLNICKFLLKHYKISKKEEFFFLEDTLINNFYGLSKILLKNDLNNIEVSNYLVGGLSQLSKLNQVEREKFFNFINYLISNNFYVDLDLLIKNSDNDYLNEKFTKLMFKQKIKDF